MSQTKSPFKKQGKKKKKHRKKMVKVEIKMIEISPNISVITPKKTLSVWTF